MTETTKTKPAHTIRYGSVQVSVWKHQTANGANYSVSTERRYKTNGQWKSTDGFFVEDLPVLAKALNEVHSWIYSQPREKPAVAGEAGA